MTNTPPSPSSTPTSSTSTSSSFLANAKRRLSEHKPGSIRESVRISFNNLNLDGFGLTSSSTSSGNSGRSRLLSGSGGSSGTSSLNNGLEGGSGNGSIAPPDHRENTPLHALKDTLVLPHLHLQLNLHLPHAPSIPSISFPFQMPTIFNMNPPANLFCFGTEEGLSDDEDDDGCEEVIPVPARMNGKGKEKVKETQSKEKEKEKKEEKDPLRRLRGNVVVLGGYRGSILRDSKTKKRLWIPLRVGFGFRKADLSLGLSDEDELTSSKTVVPGKMLMAMSGFIDLGKRLKDKFKSLEQEQILSEELDGLKFHSWGYDWRRRLELSSGELILYLEKLKRDSPVNEGATVIAHSMGGLVALYALATCSDPTIFKGILFAGTPFKGCVNVLEPLRRGDSVLFNREICSPAVVFSMRSSFYFLPSNPSSPLPCFYTPEGISLPLDFSDPKIWSKYNLSPLAGGLLEFKSPAEEVAEGEGGEEGRREEKKKKAEVSDERMGLGMGVMSGEGELGGGQSEGKEERKEKRKSGNWSLGSRSRNGSGKSTPVLGGTGGEGEEEKVESDAEILDYLTRTLERVGEFYKALATSYDPSKSHLYPPLVILTSQKTPTVKGVITTSPSSSSNPHESIKSGDYSQLLFGTGDGIVTYESATSLPPGWNIEGGSLKGVVESGNGHVSLLGDLDGVRKCLERIYPV